MKAAVIYDAGGPDVLKLENLPIPKPEPGQVLIRIKAFGLNRSELFTRQGASPDVKFPVVLGIEACGIVEEAPGGELHKGDRVATAMGGMGRKFNGSYAEYTCVPVSQVQVIKTELPWEIFGAIPEMLQTSWGSVFKALRLKKGERFLIRGGTTSIGLAAAAIAKNHGAYVATTSRRPDRVPMLQKNGADHVFIDDGKISAQIKDKATDGFDKVLELIGVTTIPDSLKCAREGGLVCMTGMVGNKWSFDEFAPMDVIPSTVGLTVYDGGPKEFMETPLEELAQQIKAGKMAVTVGKTFTLDQIVEASRTMEENKAGGKIVVLT